MIVARHLRAVEVIVEVVLLACADTDVGDIIVAVYIRNKGEPSLACSRGISLGRQPSLLDATDEGIGEHGGAGRLGPEVGLVDELVPQSLCVAVAQEALHHLSVAFHDAFVVGAVLGQSVQHFGEAHSHPTVAASPIERHIWRMVEEAVGTLQLVEILHHLVCGAVDVLAVAGRAVGPGLDNRYHVHVVYPHTCLPRVALSGEPFLAFLGILGQFPLRVGIRESHLLVALLSGEGLVETQRQGAEHVEVHVILCGDVLLVIRQEVVEAFLHLADNHVVAHGASPHQGTVPGAHLVVAQVLRVAPGGVLAVDEVVGETTSYFLRRAAGRKVFQYIILRCIYRQGKQQSKNRQ